MNESVVKRRDTCEEAKDKLICFLVRAFILASKHFISGLTSGAVQS